MRQKEIIFAAIILSKVFTPFYLPLVGLVSLMVFSYLSLLPWLYKLFLVTLFLTFTVLLPTALIGFYRRYHGWTLIQLGARERRMIPYIISIVSYFSCYYLLSIAHVPHFIGSILIAALMVQIVCAVANVAIKISTHTAAIGGVAGALMAFSLIFSFNPVWWLCVVLVLAGMVGTSRMLLRQHSLSQVIAGFLLGMVSSFVTVLLF